jgi:hypothetical protein
VQTVLLVLPDTPARMVPLVLLVLLVLLAGTVVLVTPDQTVFPALLAQEVLPVLPVPLVLLVRRELPDPKGLLVPPVLLVNLALRLRSAAVMDPRHFQAQAHPLYQAQL